MERKFSILAHKGQHGPRLKLVCFNLNVALMFESSSTSMRGAEIQMEKFQCETFSLSARCIPAGLPDSCAASLLSL